MLTRDEIRQRIRDLLGEEQIDEAQNDLPAMLVLKRGTIRVLPDGKRRIAEYHHADSGFSLIFPMMFSKGDK